MTDDPFDELGDASDREGDPFDQLESDAGAEATGDSADHGTEPDGETADGTAGDGETSAGTDPFRDRSAGDDSDPDLEDPFAGLDEPPADADPGLFDPHDGDSGTGPADDGGSDASAGLFDDGDTAGDGQAERRSSPEGPGETASSPGDGWFEGDMSGTTGASGAADAPAEEARELDDDTTIGSDVGDPLGGNTEGVPLDEADSVFEEMGTEGIDPDTVWEQLGESPPAADAEGDTHAEVSKHTYCEQCEYFSAPPDVYCTHSGTEILAFLDMETVRVVNCPIVAERRALQEQE